MTVPVAGKKIFLTTIPACGLCHTLGAAGTLGTSGPNLDKAKPAYPTIIRAVTNGIKPSRRYSGQMQAYGGALSKKQIQDLAAFIYRSTHV